MEVSGTLLVGAGGTTPRNVLSNLLDHEERLTKITYTSGAINNTAVDSNLTVGTGNNVSIDGDKVKYTSATKQLQLGSTVSLMIGTMNVYPYLTDLNNAAVKKTGAQDIDDLKKFLTIPQLKKATLGELIAASDSELVSKYHFDQKAVILTTNQDIEGVKTFAAFPKKKFTLDTDLNPSSKEEFTTKFYFDNNAVIKTTNQTIAGLKTFSTIPKLSSDLTPTSSTDLIPKKYVDDILVYTPSSDLYTMSHNLAIDSSKKLTVNSKDVEAYINKFDNLLSGFSYVPDMTSIDNHVMLLKGNNLLLENSDGSTLNVRSQMENRALLTGNNTFKGINTFQDDSTPLSIQTKNNTASNNALFFQHASGSTINPFVQTDDIMIWSGMSKDSAKSSIFIGPWSAGLKGIRVSLSKFQVGPGIIETPSYELNASGAATTGSTTTTTSLMTIKPNTYNGGLEVCTTNASDLSAKNVRLSITNSKVSVFGTSLEVKDDSTTVSRNQLKLYNTKPITFYKGEEGTQNVTITFDDTTNSLTYDTSASSYANHTFKVFGGSGNSSKTILRTHACSGWNTPETANPSLLLKQHNTISPFLKIYVNSDFAKALNYRIPISVYRKGTITISTYSKYVITEKINDVKLYYQETQSDFTTTIG